jgi:hypothetical protein
MCDKPINSLQNYGEDIMPLCYACKIIYDREQERKETECREQMRYKNENLLKQNTLYDPAIPEGITYNICRADFLSCDSDNIDTENIRKECNSDESNEKPNSSIATFEVPNLNSSCINHPQVTAQFKCIHCNAALCPTCAFSFPGDIHLCPVCIRKKPSELNPKIKRNACISIFTAAFSFFSWFFLVITQDKLEDTLYPAAIGWIALLFTLFPAITGYAMGVGVLPKKGKKPILLLIGIICNSILIAFFILFAIIGIFMA